MRFSDSAIELRNNHKLGLFNLQSAHYYRSQRDKCFTKYVICSGCADEYNANRAKLFKELAHTYDNLSIAHYINWILQEVNEEY